MAAAVAAAAVATMPRAHDIKPMRFTAASLFGGVRLID